MPFKNKHGKRYATEQELEKGKNVFRQNLRFIHSKNRATLGFLLAVNYLTDRTEEEMAALRWFSIITNLQRLVGFKHSSRFLLKIIVNLFQVVNPSRLSIPKT
jgi:hypothetical protein